MRIHKLCIAALLLAPNIAFAQNCESIKSGIGATRKAQNVGRQFVGNSLDFIQERGWIQFAVYSDFAPYSFEKEGKLTGIDIDLGIAIAKYLGVKARFYATEAGENVDADLRFNIWKGRLVSGPIANVMLHIPYNRELGCRNEHVVLNGQYFNEQIAIAYSAEDYTEEGPVPAYFRYDKVGVENDSISDFYLSGVANGQLIPNMVRYKSTNEAMEALKAGDIKAVMGPLAQLEYELNTKTKIHTPPLPGLAVGQWTLGIAVRHNWRPLSYSVDDAIRQAVEDGTMETIFKKYGLSYTLPKW